MTTSTVAPEIARFAAAVRDALADLPDEERDELTDGLEADLSESLAEDLRRTLPDPVAYAAELRAAAGLPVRARKRGTFAGLAQSGRDTLTDIGIATRRNPALAGALDFLGSLRPLWWILRAWVAFQVALALLGTTGRWIPTDLVQWLVLAAFVVVSVQWGRGCWITKGIRPLIVVGNVVAVIALLPALAGADTPNYGDTYSASSEPVPQGLSMNGHPLENIYVYGSDGKPLHNVQLFDVDGKPLETSRNTDESPLNPLPATLETGAKAYNVFPLSLAWMMYDENGDWVPNPSPDPGKKKAFLNGPFLKVPSVLDQKVSKSNH